jgi:hypothetical protein
MGHWLGGVPAAQGRQTSEGTVQSPSWRQPGTQAKSLQTSPALHCTSSALQVPAGMQTPLRVSQIEPAAQSAVESQRRRGWQKPAALQLSAAAHDESALQRQAPVDGSQEKPGEHCVSLAHRLCAPRLQPAAPASRSSSASHLTGAP